MYNLKICRLKRIRRLWSKYLTPIWYDPINDTKYYIVGTRSQRHPVGIGVFPLVTGSWGKWVGTWRGARMNGGMRQALRRFKVETVYEPAW